MEPVQCALIPRLHHQPHHLHVCPVETNDATCRLGIRRDHEQEAADSLQTSSEACTSSSAKTPNELLKEQSRATPPLEVPHLSSVGPVRLKHLRDCGCTQELGKGHLKARQLLALGRKNDPEARKRAFLPPIQSKAQETSLRNSIPAPVVRTFLPPPLRPAAPPLT